MSGIVARVQAGGGLANRAFVERATESLRYRGPDGSGVWADGEVALGHTLHVATLEAQRERQPFARGGVVVTADARIDAREPLRQALERAGAPVGPDAPDVELIAAAYLAWGERCVERLLGDFSFALWDEAKKQLLCAVDPLGVRPFYYASHGGLFVGSNSLHCVREHPGVTDALDPSAVRDFLLAGYNQERAGTVYRDIARLDRGSYLVLREGELRTARYFTFPEPGEGRAVPEAECVAAFDELLHAAITDRLRTPRVAVLMSGGIDSPLIAARAQAILRAQRADAAIEAFTIVSDEHIPDREGHFAGIAARALDIPIDLQNTRGAESCDWTETLVPPQPIGSTMIRRVFEQRARIAARFPVCLTGFDGDALLWADVRYHWPQRLRQRRLISLLAELRWYVRHAGAPPIGARTALARLRRGVRPSPSPARWLRPAFRARTGATERTMSPPRSHPRAIAADNFRHPMWGELFDHFDPELSRLALEVRHPLADLRLIRFALDLPAIPFCVDKRLLRVSAARDLPPAIVTRPKAPMPGEPDLIKFRKSGLGPSARGWRVPELEEYVDCAAIESALERRNVSDTDFYPALRAVALGLWLTARRRGGKDGAG